MIHSLFFVMFFQRKNKDPFFIEAPAGNTAFPAVLLVLVISLASVWFFVHIMDWMLSPWSHHIFFSGTVLLAASGSLLQFLYSRGRPLSILLDPRERLLRFRFRREDPVEMGVGQFSAVGIRFSRSRTYALYLLTEDGGRLDIASFRTLKSARKSEDAWRKTGCFSDSGKDRFCRSSGEELPFKKLSQSDGSIVFEWTNRGIIPLLFPALGLLLGFLLVFRGSLESWILRIPAGEAILPILLSGLLIYLGQQIYEFSRSRFFLRIQGKHLETGKIRGKKEQIFWKREAGKRDRFSFFYEGGGSYRSLFFWSGPAGGDSFDPGFQRLPTGLRNAPRLNLSGFSFRAVLLLHSELQSTLHRS